MISPARKIFISSDLTQCSAGTLGLDSSQLTDFGAASLLIGGFRTTTDAGTTVEVTTNNLVVDNSGASTVSMAKPLTDWPRRISFWFPSGLSMCRRLGDRAIWPVSGNAQTLTLQGDGALLRVSSDASAQISRQNVTPDTTSALSIGQGVMIVNANGGAVGALTLDSTNLLTFPRQPARLPFSAVHADPRQRIYQP